jgi:hypothetical protein
MFNAAGNNAFGEEKTYEVKSFKAIGLSIAADLYFTLGEREVSIEASRDDLDEISLEVDGSTLEIKAKNTFNSSFGEIKIYVSNPTLEEISLAGAGSIFCGDPLELDEMTINLAGSGEVKLQSLICRELEAKLAGSCEIDIMGGEAKEMEVDLAGLADINAQNFRVAEIEANIAGSGDIYLHVTNKIEAQIIGSGSIHYKGNPRKEITSLGSGGAIMIK